MRLLLVLWYLQFVLKNSHENDLPKFDQSYVVIRYRLLLSNKSIDELALIIGLRKTIAQRINNS
jgi:hypothetical protein